jgi:hypothetical protein
MSTLLTFNIAPGKRFISYYRRAEFHDALTKHPERGAIYPPRVSSFQEHVGRVYPLGMESKNQITLPNGGRAQALGASPDEHLSDCFAFHARFPLTNVTPASTQSRLAILHCNYAPLRQLSASAITLSVNETKLEILLRKVARYPNL